MSNDSFGGRRIVDINYIFSQIQILNSKIHNPGLGCSFMNVELVNEIKKKGLRQRGFLNVKCVIY